MIALPIDLKWQQQKHFAHSESAASRNMPCRVKDLESLQSQVAQNHGKELVDEQALQEMELLRQRVMKLEGQASNRAEEGAGPAAHGAQDAALADLNAELMQEMEEVRRRVMELQVCFRVLAKEKLLHLLTQHHLATQVCGCCCTAVLYLNSNDVFGKTLHW